MYVTQRPRSRRSFILFTHGRRLLLGAESIASAFHLHHSNKSIMNVLTSRNFAGGNIEEGIPYTPDKEPNEYREHALMDKHRKSCSCSVRFVSRYNSTRRMFYVPILQRMSTKC